MIIKLNIETRRIVKEVTEHTFEYPMYLSDGVQRIRLLRILYHETPHGGRHLEFTTLMHGFAVATTVSQWTASIGGDGVLNDYQFSRKFQDLVREYSFVSTKEQFDFLWKQIRKSING